MFNPTRSEVRLFFIEAWKKHRDGEIQTPLETIAIDWILEHPEFHGALEAGPAALEEDFTPERERANPYLHLAMHLSITEQLSIDQPAGIRAATLALAGRLDSLHAAHHAVMECLGQMLWIAQRNETEPDGQAYLECVRKKAG